MKISKITVLEFIGEFIATFILAFLLYTSPMLAGGIEPFVIAFMVMALWQIFSAIAKVQMNPAVALGEYVVVLLRSVVQKKFYLSELFRFLGYMLTQFLAFLAAFPLAAWLREEIVRFQMEKNEYGTSDEIKKQFLSTFAFGNSYTEGYIALAFVLEVLMAFLIVFAFIRMSNSAKFKQYTGLIWGLVVFTAIIFASQISGASFNPWRSLVPAIFEGGTALSQVGVYIIAPFVGALLAALLHAVLKWLEKPGKSKVIKSSEKKTVSKKGKKR